MIIAYPEIKKYPLSKDVEFMIVACDGIWDCLTNQEAVDFMAEELKKKQDVSTGIENMFEEIIAPDIASNGGLGCDNMTCTVVQFKH